MPDDLGGGVISAAIIPFNLKRKKQNKSNLTVRLTNIKTIHFRAYEHPNCLVFTLADYLST